MMGSDLGAALMLGWGLFVLVMLAGVALVVVWTLRG